MEIREIGQTLYRRWWIPCAIAMIVGFLGIFQLLYFPVSYILEPVDDEYQVIMRMLVGVTPAPASQTDNFDYDPRYFAWLVSEYLVDDFSQVLKSGLFAKRVSARLEDQNIMVEPDLIQGASQTGHWHRILTILFSGDDEEELFAIAEAAQAELEENASFYFYQLGTDDSRILLLDEPILRNKRKSIFEDRQGEMYEDETHVPFLPGWFAILMALLQRMLTAFMVGTVLVFVIDYLEGSIRGRRPLDDMGIPVMGIVPGIQEPPKHLVPKTAKVYWHRLRNRFRRMDNRLLNRFRRTDKRRTVPQLSEEYT